MQKRTTINSGTANRYPVDGLLARFHNRPSLINSTYRLLKSLSVMCKSPFNLPIGSMYAIYGNIYHQYTPNVSIYAIHGSYGFLFWFLHGSSAAGYIAQCFEAAALLAPAVPSECVALDSLELGACDANWRRAAQVPWDAMDAMGCYLGMKVSYFPGWNHGYKPP
jgi:hypothetical protein